MLPDVIVSRSQKFKSSGSGVDEKGMEWVVARAGFIQRIPECHYYVSLTGTIPLLGPLYIHRQVFRLFQGRNASTIMRLMLRRIKEMGSSTGKFITLNRINDGSTHPLTKVVCE